MAPPKMTMGKGAVVSVLSSKLHPSEHIRRMFPNMEKNHRVENLVVLQQKVKKINRRDQLALVMTHNDFKLDGKFIELHASRKFCVLKKEGDKDYFFDDVPVGQNLEPNPLEDNPREIQDVIECSHLGPLDQDDVDVARNFIEIDDDNNPAPENVPQAGETLPENIFGEWGHQGMCFRHMTGTQNRNPTISFLQNVRPTLLQLFELLFPMNYVKSVILPLINKEINGAPVEYWEFLVFLGIWFLMAMIQGPQWKDFWSLNPVSRYDRSSISD